MMDCWVKNKGAMRRCYGQYTKGELVRKGTAKGGRFAAALMFATILIDLHRPYRRKLLLPNLLHCRRQTASSR